MVDIKKLPPGKAYGADDLVNWASRRMGGWSGVYDRREEKKEKKHAKQLSKQAGYRVKPFRDLADEWLRAHEEKKVTCSSSVWKKRKRRSRSSKRSDLREHNLRVGIERDVRELSEKSAERVAHGKESTVWCGTPEAFEAEVQRRLDGSPGYRRTRLQGEDGRWGAWEPF